MGGQFKGRRASAPRGLAAPPFADVRVRYMRSGIWRRPNEAPRFAALRPDEPAPTRPAIPCSAIRRCATNDKRCSAIGASGPAEARRWRRPCPRQSESLEQLVWQRLSVQWSSPTKLRAAQQGGATDYRPMAALPRSQAPAAHMRCSGPIRPRSRTFPPHQQQG